MTVASLRSARPTTDTAHTDGGAGPGGFRWLLVAAGLLLQFSIGAVYAWSVFGGALEKAAPWELGKVRAALPFEVTIGMIFIGTYIGGRLQDKRGPRVVALAGGVIYAVGIVLASFARSADQLWLLILGYGVISGFGLGVAYIVPIAMLQKWFPDKKGLITGLAVGGFGFGAVLTAPVAQWLIDKDPSQPTKAFLWLGIAYLVMSLIGASLFRNPPSGYVVPGHEDEGAAGEKAKDVAGAVAAKVPGVKKEKKEKQPKPPKAAAVEKPLTPAMIDLRVGHILKAERHPNADSLFVSTINCGDAPGTDNTSEYEGKIVRTVCSGLNGLIPLEDMQNRKVVTVCNLKPVTMRGIKSCAMVLAASPRLAPGVEDNHAGPVGLVDPPVAAEAGDRVYFEGWEGEPEPVLNPKKKVWDYCQVGFTTTEAKEIAFDVSAVEQLKASGKTGLATLKTKSGNCTVPSLTGGIVR